MTLLKLLNTGSWRLWKHSASLWTFRAQECSWELLRSVKSRRRIHSLLLRERKKRTYYRTNSQEFSHSNSFGSLLFWSEGSTLSGSFNSVIVKCFHSPRPNPLSSFLSSLKPWQTEDSQLPSLLELNLLWASNKSKQTISIDSIAKTRKQNKTLEASQASLSRNENLAGREVRHICIRCIGQIKHKQNLKTLHMYHTFLWKWVTVSREFSYIWESKSVGIIASVVPA